MTQPFSTFSPEPDLMDALASTKKEVMLNLKCHHIGIIQSFDKDKQIATAKIPYGQTVFRRDPKTKQYVSVLIDYPPLVDCPVICLGGGGTALTFPVAVGDECLVLFNDRDINKWFAGNTSGGVATPRLHSIADGLIIVGVRSLAHSLTGYDPQREVMRSGKARLGVGIGNKVLVANVDPTVGGGGGLTYSTTLNTLLQQLLTEVKNLANACAAITVGPGTGLTQFTADLTTGKVTGTSSTPGNASDLTAVATAVTATATAIAGLLE